MDKQRLISHAMAIEPGIPAYQVSAFALELVERLRTEGSEKTIRITEKTAFRAIIPSNVLSVNRVFANGVEVPQTLPPDYIAPPETTIDWGLEAYLADSDGALLMEGDNYLVEVEGEAWGDDTYIADADGSLLMENTDYITE